MTIREGSDRGQTPNIRHEDQALQTEGLIMNGMSSIRGGYSGATKRHGLAVPPEQRFWSKVDKTAPSWSKPGAVVTVPPGGCAIVRNSEEVGE